MNTQETLALQTVIADFRPALETLDRYDHEQLAYPKSIADGTLVALTLLIAESKPEERETMVKLATNLLGM